MEELQKVEVILILGLFNMITPSSGQVILTSSLDVGQRFVCLGERVLYVCSGPGALMGLYAPPLLSRNDRAAFVNTSTPGSTGFVDGLFTATLLSTSPFTGQLIIDSNNIGLKNFDIVCENGPIDTSFTNVVRQSFDVENETKITITDGSAVPMDGDFYLGVMYLSWVALNGSFDVDHYEILVFRNDEQAPLMMFKTISTSMTATYSGTVMDTAYASIVIISRCGLRSLPFVTNRVSPQLSGSVVATIVFMVIFFVLLMAALIALVVEHVIRE